MTDFFSTYLFLCLAVILLIVSLIFKYRWLFFADAICWLFVGIYCLAHQDPTQPFIVYLGVFCLFLFVGIGMAPFIMFRQPKIFKDGYDIEEWEQESLDESNREKNYLDKMGGRK